jgi:hypothetical protein
MDLYKFTGMQNVGGTWQETPLETGCSYSVADFEGYNREVTEDLRKSLFIQPELLAGSDYSGGTLQRSNNKAFLDSFGDVEGVYEIRGGMGTYGVAVRLDVYENNKEIKETLDSLEDYPLINEDLFSEMENELDCVAMKDIVSDLCRDINLEIYIPDYDDLLEDTEKIEQYAWDAVNDLNLEFTHENDSSYLNSNELQTYVEDMLLINNCNRNKLPLLINRKWSCSETEQKFKDKLSCKEALC